MRSRVVVGKRVIEGEPKSRASRRHVAIDQETATDLADPRRGQLEAAMRLGSNVRRPEHVLAWPTGEPVHPQSLTQAFRRLVEKSGLPQIRLHDLRHSSATSSLEAGAPMWAVSARLGHSDPGFTQRVYVHATPVQDRAVAEVLSRALANKADVNMDVNIDRG